MNYNIAVIAGDGIGPEIVREARKVLDAAGAKYGFTLHYTDLLMGGASIDVHGIPLTDETIEAARKSDAVLMGSIQDLSLVPASAGEETGGRAFEDSEVSEPVCQRASGVSL